MGASESCPEGHTKKCVSNKNGSVKNVTVTSAANRARATAQKTKNKAKQAMTGLTKTKAVQVATHKTNSLKGGKRKKKSCKKGGRRKQKLAPKSKKRKRSQRRRRKKPQTWWDYFFG